MVAGCAGQQEIEEIQEDLERRLRGRGTDVGELTILPVYSTLPSELQARIFEPTPGALAAIDVVVATTVLFQLAPGKSFLQPTSLRRLLPLIILFM